MQASNDALGVRAVGSVGVTELEAAIYRLYVEEGLTAREVAQRLGLPAWKVGAILRKHEWSRTRGKSLSLLRTRKAESTRPTREWLVAQYCERGLADAAIAAMLGKSRAYVQKLRRIYRIETLPRIERYENRHPDELALQVLLGTLLGDGHLFRVRRSQGPVRLELSQVEHHGEYLRWKVGVLSQFLELSEPKLRPQQTSPHWIWRVHSKVHPFLANLYLHFYDESGRRRLTDAAIAMIREPALAVWYFDDGSWHHARWNDFYAIYSLAYSEEENHRLARHIEHAFGLRATVHKKRSNGRCYLTIRQSDTLAMTAILEKYVGLFPCMRYKVSGAQVREAA